MFIRRDCETKLNQSGGQGLRWSRIQNELETSGRGGFSGRFHGRERDLEARNDYSEPDRNSLYGIRDHLGIQLGVDAGRHSDLVGASCVNRDLSDARWSRFLLAEAKEE